MKKKTNILIDSIIYHVLGKPYTVIEVTDGEFPVKCTDEEGNIVFMNPNVNEYGIHAWFITNPAQTKNPVIAFYRTLPDVSTDQYVLVRTTAGDMFRFFSHFDEKDNAYCFKSGANSVTTNSKPTLIRGKWFLVNQTTFETIDETVDKTVNNKLK